MTKTCQTCGNEFTIDDSACLTDFDRTIWSMKLHCDPCCAASEAAERQREEKREQMEREQRWDLICPPLYRSTDFAHPGLIGDFVSIAREWTPRAGERGLGFMGSSGGGKTRLLFTCLRRAFDAGFTVHATNHHHFARLVIEAFSGSDDARERAQVELRRLERVEVLLLDDLGKAPSTERCDAELECLIETRGSHLRPILWSANGHGQWLIDRFGPDRGAPIVRRLAEFSTVVKA
jgi:DNA replication protein DnaC